ncbi:MAG: MBL fold metallo-hydrolase [Bacteroidota bacterium]
MIKLLNILKRMLLIILSIIVLLVGSYLVFVRITPAFGGDVSKELKTTYSKISEQHKNGKFENINGVDDDINFSKGLKIMRKMLFEKNPNAKPSKEIPIIDADSTQIANYEGETRLMWFGHSSFLLQIEGQQILIDPMLTDMPAPINRDAQKRFYEELPIEMEQLPNIDAVLISHDHYDHLDYKSITNLKDKVGHFYVPLGVGVHLKAWGVQDKRITEMDWWETKNFKGLNFISAPAQHFSGRKFDNRNSTLWCSWIIQSSNDNIYFSGDGGYNGHFKTIGDKYGPFDFAMIECGQYNQMWAKIHMMPEETVQAGIDLRAKKMMPIHWGTFTLALHDWNEPVIRAVKRARELKIPITTPKIGEFVLVNDENLANQIWWN